MAEKPHLFGIRHHGPGCANINSAVSYCESRNTICATCDQTEEDEQ
jgi:hypothetical protein